VVNCEKELNTMFWHWNRVRRGWHFGGWSWRHWGAGCFICTHSKPSVVRAIWWYYPQDQPCHYMDSSQLHLTDYSPCSCSRFCGCSEAWDRRFQHGCGCGAALGSMLCSRKIQQRHPLPDHAQRSHQLEWLAPLFKVVQLCPPTKESHLSGTPGTFAP
jgi:hypothetical protein